MHQLECNRPCSQQLCSTSYVLPSPATGFRCRRRHVAGRHHSHNPIAVLPQNHRAAVISAAQQGGGGGLLGGLFGGSKPKPLGQPETFMQSGTDEQPEFPPYQTIKRTKDYDVRLYNVYPVVEMQYEQRQEGYAGLGSYIDGENSDGSRFAYTQPVFMRYTEPTGAGEKVMQMYIGSRRGSSDKDAPISLAALPAPKDPKVRVSIAGGELLAVARFEGYITPTSAEATRKRLLAALQQDQSLKLSDEAKAGGFRVGQYGAMFSLSGRINELYIKLQP